MKPIISLIVAVSENQVIGKDNQLLWHLPADLKYFKEQTLGKPVIMGRKTFDSIVEVLGHPLSNRQNIVITRNEDFCYENVLKAKNLEQGVQLASERPEIKCPEIMIIGGASIFEPALSIADRIYFTRVHHVFEGDVFFPVLDSTQWKVVKEEKHDNDDKNPYAYTFFIYEK